MRTPLLRIAVAAATIVGLSVIAAPAKANPADATVHTAPVCSTATGSAVRASRTTGAAPLMVYFDTLGAEQSRAPSATHSSYLTRDLVWNFGEYGQLWKNGRDGEHLNSGWDKGPAVGHLYTKPGKYLVRVYNASNTATPWHSCTITVEDPEKVWAGDTVCYSSTGNFSGCPASVPASQRIKRSDFNAIALDASKPGAKKRILLRRGDTFTLSKPAVIERRDATWAGPGYIGAFGSGTTKPVVKLTSSWSVKWQMALSVGNGNAKHMRDWRVVGIHFDGSARPSMADGIGPGLFNSQFTAYDNLVTGMRVGLMVNPSLFGQTHDSQGRPIANDKVIWDQIGLVSNTVVMRPGQETPYGAFVGGERVFFAGNRIEGFGNGSTHSARFPYLGLSSIVHNTLVNPGHSSHNIKLHGPLHCTMPASTVGYDAGELREVAKIPGLCHSLERAKGIGRGYSRWVTVADNSTFSQVNVWPIAVAPQDVYKDEKLADIRVERNVIESLNANLGVVVGDTTGAVVSGNVVYRAKADTRAVWVRPAHQGDASLPRRSGQGQRAHDASPLRDTWGTRLGPERLGGDDRPEQHRRRCVQGVGVHS